MLGCNADAIEDAIGVSDGTIVVSLKPDSVCTSGYENAGFCKVCINNFKIYNFDQTIYI